MGNLMDRRTSAIVAVASSLLGIGFTIAGFSFPPLAWPLIIVGALLLVIAALGYLQNRMIQSYAGPPIDGHWWMRDWRHEHESKDKEETESKDAVLSQAGRRVSGTFTNQRGSYKLSGIIQDRVLAGTWRQVQVQDDHEFWYGSFQFLISPDLEDQKTMAGRWVGFDRKRTIINCGEWEWCRPRTQYPSERT